MRLWTQHEYQGGGSLVRGRGSLSLAAMASGSREAAAGAEFCVTDNLMGVRGVEAEFVSGLPEGEVAVTLHNGQQIEASVVVILELQTIHRFSQSRRRPLLGVKTSPINRLQL